MVNKNQKPIFDIKDRGFRVRAWWPGKKDNSGDALVEIRKKGRFYRKFKWPAYKIFNIAAHFQDIVDGELEKTNDKLSGYKIAGSPF
jgi:hypothetical protein